MKIVIEKNSFLDNIILIMMVLQVMIFRWFGIHDKINAVILFLILLSFIKNRFITSKHSVILVLLLFFGYQVFNYIALGGTIRFLMRNGYRTFKSIVFIIYLSFLSYKKRDFCTEFMRKSFWLFNIYMLLNIPVLLLQLNGHYSLSAFYNLGSISSYYQKDLISGLLGRYGTPCLAFYSVFIALYNYIYGRIWIKHHKRVLTFYNILLLLFNLVISTQNDNKGYYIVFVMMVILMYLNLKEAQIIKRSGTTHGVLTKLAIRLIILVATFTIILTILYKCFPQFSKNIVDLLLKKINEGLTQGENVRGGGERIGMIIFMLSKPSKLALGYGLGNYSPTATSLGFLHFGLADFGTYLCLGGMTYIILLFLILYKVFELNTKNYLNIVTLIMVIIFSIYTQVFSNTSTTICMMFIYWICWIVHDWKKEIAVL